MIQVFLNHIRNVSRIIERYGLSHVVLTNPSNIVYFTGVESGNLLVIDSGLNVTLIVPRLEYERVNSLLTDTNYGIKVIGYSTIEVPPRRPGESLFVGSSLGRYLIDIERLGSGSVVGIDNVDSSVGKVLSGHGIRCIDINDDLARIRMVKDDNEIQLIRRATQITDESLKYVWESGLEGKRERDIAAMIQDFMIRNGADEAAYKPIIASGPNGAYPHHNYSDRVIVRGDLVTIDAGARFNLYRTDITRTFAVGNISKELRDMAHAVLEALNKALSVIKPGVSVRDVDLAARSVLEEYGYGAYTIWSMGHGVGIDIHEKPFLSPYSNDVLSKGVVIAVEPGIYIKGVGGVRIEDTIVVTDTGAEVLSSFPRDLFG